MEIDYGLLISPAPEPIHVSPTIGWGETPRAHMQRLVREIAERRGVLPDLVLSDDRREETVRARQEAMHLLYDLGYSYPRIGRFFGRDHTTVIYSVRRHRERTNARS